MYVSGISSSVVVSQLPSRAVSYQQCTGTTVVPLVPDYTVQWIVSYLVGTTARAYCGVRGHSSTTVVPVHC